MNPPLTAKQEYQRAYNRAYYRANRERLTAENVARSHLYREKKNSQARKRYEANKDRINEWHAVYRAKNKKRIAEAARKYQAAKKEEIAAYKRKWKAANPGWHSNYIRKRSAVDPQFKVAYLLRNRVRRALKQRFKSGSAVESLGCSVPEALVHIASLFKPGMSWENHGLWHIDHKVPLASFDLSDASQLAKACHYSNLQPLWAKENISKRDRLEGGGTLT